MESALYGVYTLVVLCQKSHSFATLTCSISDTPRLVCKHRTGAGTFHVVFYMYRSFIKSNLIYFTYVCRQAKCL